MSDTPNIMRFEALGRSYEADVGKPLSLAIPLDFAGPQPSCFDAPRASAQPLRAGGFVGDTRAGGSCNCEVVTFAPHCNGTHTECVGHVTDDRVAVSERVPGGLVLARLVTVAPEAASVSTESSDPHPSPDDRLVTAAALAAACARAGAPLPSALVVRTTSEDPHRAYRGPAPAPFLTREAAAWLVARAIDTLVLDLPSADRADIEPNHPGAMWRYVEVIVPREALQGLAAGVRPGGVEPAGSLALEALRIAAWRPRFATEVDEKTLPHELDWLRSAVDLHKGCYRGQETVAKVVNLGRPPRRLVMLHLDGSDTVLPKPGDAVIGVKVRPEPTPGEEPERRVVGHVTSAGMHHELGPIALAVVKRAVPPELELIVESHGIDVAAAQVEIVPADAGAAVEVPRLPRLGVRP